MLPRIQTALNGWQQTITLIKITQTVSTDGEVTNTQTLIVFKGVVQPLEAEKLKIKPEGQRSWKWLQIHTKTRLSLVNGDQITYNNVNCKVMDIKDYNAYGYYEYNIVQNWES